MGNGEEDDRNHRRQDQEGTIPERFPGSHISAHESSIACPLTYKRDDGAGKAQVHQYRRSGLKTERETELRVGIDTERADQKQSDQNTDSLQAGLAQHKAREHADQFTNSRGGSMDLRGSVLQFWSRLLRTKIWR